MDDFKDRAEELIENFVNFNMSLPPRFERLSAVEAEILTSSLSWGMLRDYLDELNELGKLDWIGFRNDMQTLYNCVSKWSDRVNEKFAAGNTDQVITHLSLCLEHLRSAVPVLKYCHGKDFKDAHWSALLQGQLGLSKEVRLESLTLGHFLDILDKMVEPSLLPFVKQLQSRAQGEVIVREALQELNVWSQTAHLTLIEHEEQGRRTSLIKEWKDLLLDLGDKQALLASLKDSQFYRTFEDVGKESGPRKHMYLFIPL